MQKMANQERLTSSYSPDGHVICNRAYLKSNNKDCEKRFGDTWSVCALNLTKRRG